MHLVFDFIVFWLMDEGFIHENKVVVSASLIPNIVKYFDFDFCACVIPLYCSDNFYGIVVLILYVLTFQRSSKSSIAQMTQNFIIPKHVANFIYEMACVFLSVSGSFRSIILWRLGLGWRALLRKAFA